uniref:Protein YIP n=1 Tax=Tetraselmis sp. GSL018 TaxID=582737 RepID=A0A061R986_9CHLO|mmetsp:Transcript_20633/g.49113  ORF Transcript_20633/g.49113 Transcript_20633/m.49113 type:complete len:235 (-) Transcript_20633:454-1158(-)
MDSGAWGNGSEQNFSENVAPVDTQAISPVHERTPQAVSGRMEPARGSVVIEGMGGAHSTLDEPVWQTIKRDLNRVVYNLKVVLFPGYAQWTGKTKSLRDWDLWGPLVFTLVLAICLSQGSPKAGSIFSVVILVIGLGAVVLTLNVILLGGHIQFFQAVSLLGYCLFPLDVVALISILVHNAIARGIMLLLALAWCFWSAIPFVSGSVPERRKALAVYPVLMLYTSVSWLALTKP